MTEPTQIPVDPGAVIQGLSDRLAAATLEIVQLRVVLGTMEGEIASLRAAQAPQAPQTDPVNGSQVPMHTLPRPQEN